MHFAAWPPGLDQRSDAVRSSSSMKQVPDLKDVRGEQALSRHPIYQCERETVARLLGQLRSAATPQDFYEFHRDLFIRFLATQRLLGELAEQKETSKAELRVAKTQGADAGVRQLSQQLANIDSDRRVARAVLSILRQLGDALAWTLLGFKRSAATVLGEGKRVDRLASGPGLEAELAAIDQMWEAGVIAIHTDITSCLQHGDILSITALEPRRYGLTEIKAAGKRADPSQQKRLERAIQLLNTGSHPRAAGGGPLEITCAPVAYRSHVRAAAAAIEQARERSYVALELEDGLAAEVYDESNPARLSRQDFEAREATFRAGLGWSEGDRIKYSTSARRLRDRTQSFSSLAPLPLLPFSVEVTAELMMGGFDIVTTINAARLEQRLADRGIDAEVARGEGVEDTFLTASRGRATVTVPATVREQISVELMRIETLIATVDWHLGELAKLEIGAPQMVIDYAEESAYWSPL